MVVPNDFTVLLMLDLRVIWAACIVVLKGVMVAYNCLMRTIDL